MTTILDRIIATKAREVEAARQRLSFEALQQAVRKAPPLRDFTAALRGREERNEPAVIAEIKKASPSKGLLREDFRPAEIAVSYARHGAACLSVLTDRDYFQGAPDFLKQAREACALPVLRKDFIVDPYQVLETRAMGADALLLIVAALEQPALESLAAQAGSLGLAVLAEVHDEAELECALRLDTPLIGVNNRNLKSFDTSLETTLRLRERVPPGRLLITESGIASREDVLRMWAQGVKAFLVGESLMRDPDPGAALENLFGRLPG